MNLKFKLEGLDCANCAAELERKIGKIDGIKSVSIGFMTQRMEIECRDEESEKIIKEVKKTIKKEEPDVIVEKL